MENLLTLNMLWLLDKVLWIYMIPMYLRPIQVPKGALIRTQRIIIIFFLKTGIGWRMIMSLSSSLCLTCAPFVGIQELFWCRQRPELCTQPRCPRGRRFWDKWSTIGEVPTIKRDDKWRKSLTIDTYWRPPLAAQQAPPCPWTSRGAPWSTSPTSWTSRAWWSGIT